MSRFAPFLIIAVLAIMAAKLIQGRRHAHASFAERMRDRVSDVDISDSVDALMDQAEASLKEIRKRIRG